MASRKEYLLILILSQKVLYLCVFIFVLNCFYCFLGGVGFSLPFFYNEDMAEELKLTELAPNEGQIDGLPANPRQISSEKLEQLVKSLQDDPEMLNLREVLVVPHGGKYVIIGGNMRYRAALRIGMETIPCKILPENTPVEKLRAITIKDNTPFGAWDFAMLGVDWDSEELAEWGVEGVEEADVDLDKFFAPKEENTSKKKTAVCPHCGKGFEL